MNIDEILKALRDYLLNPPLFATQTPYEITGLISSLILGYPANITINSGDYPTSPDVNGVYRFAKMGDDNRPVYTRDDIWTLQSGDGNWGLHYWDQGSNQVAHWKSSSPDLNNSSFEPLTTTTATGNFSISFTKSTGLSILSGGLRLATNTGFGAFGKYQETQPANIADIEILDPNIDLPTLIAKYNDLAVKVNAMKNNILQSTGFMAAE